METDAAVATELCQAVFGSCFLNDFLTVLRTIALLAGAIFIPTMLSKASRNSQVRRETADLLRSFHDNAYIVDKMHRLRKYRAHLEDPVTINNPYDSSIDLHWDHIIVLNFFEAACVEIDNGTVDRKTALLGAGSTIKGVYAVLLERMIEYGVCSRDDYPAMSAVVASIEAYERSNHTEFSTKIPNGAPLSNAHATSNRDG